MRSALLAAQALYLLLTLLVLKFGLFLLFLAFLPSTRFWISQILLQSTLLGWLGATAIVAALLMLVLFILFRPRHLYRLGMGASIDVSLIEQAICDACLPLFSDRRVRCSVVARYDGKLSIALQLPPTPEEERDALLCRVDALLAALLRDRFGYTRRFTCSTRFLK